LQQQSLESKTDGEAKVNTTIAILKDYLSMFVLVAHFNENFIKFTLKTY